MTAGFCAAQASFLDDIANGVALRPTLEHLVLQIEGLAFGLKGSVLLAERARLRFAAAPSLPAAYNSAVDGVLIGEGFGSCGTAAHRRQLVVVEDVSSDPLWKNYRDIARRYCLAACWSVPIFGRAGDLLGTFALYYDKPRRPTSAELDLVQAFARLAGIAIELYRREEKLREAGRGLRERDGPAGHIIVNPAVFADITQRKRDEAEARLLTEAGAIVGSTLDPDETLRELGAMATREFAHWCAVFLLDGEQHLRCAALCHRDAAKTARRADLDRLLLQSGGVPLRLSAVLATGQSELLGRGLFDDPEPGAVRSELQRLLRELGTESAITVALLRPARVLGAIVFASVRPDHPYAPADVVIAEELARRTALAVENGQLYREAQEAILQRERFLAVAAHELRSPLAALQLNIQAIRRQLDRPDFSKESLMSRALAGEAQSHRLARLIDDLLDVSRIRAGQLSLVPQPLDLVEAVHRVVGRFRDELLAKGVEVVLHAPSSVLGCWDPLRIEQVITNLVSNGIKYGEGKAVVVAVEANDGTATLRVEDHGAGMSPELTRRLFQPFERGVPAGLIRGLGLGLYITAQLVEAHHGRISVQSTPGVGSTFVVELPQEAAA